MNKHNFPRLNQLILSITFITILCTPILFMSTGGEKSLLENRTLATTPEFIIKNEINTNVKKDLETYLNDNIGFKDLLIKLDILTKYKLFGVFQIPERIQGLNGRDFHTYGDGTINNIMGKNLMSEIDKKTNANILVKLRDRFALDNVPMIFMAIPDGETVYPEDFPAYVRNIAGGKTRLSDFMDYLKGTDVNSLYILNDLMANKKDNNLYNKYQDPMHWNMNGAFVGYTSLMKTVQKLYPSVKIFTKDDFDIQYTPVYTPFRHGNINAFKFLDIEDSLPWYKEKFLSNVTTSTLHTERGTNIFYYKNKDKTLPKLFIVGDSYLIWFNLHLISESFSETYFVWHLDLKDANEVMEIYQKSQPNIVLIQALELNLYPDSYFNKLNLETLQ